MSADDVIVWLKGRRDLGIHDFFSVKEIKDAMGLNGCNTSNVWSACIKNERFGILEGKQKFDVNANDRPITFRTYRLSLDSWERLK